jgi:LAO/AO transport system kinase
MVRVLDAYGADVVLVETVGVGQDELEITRTAHTTLVVMAPGMGDEVQAFKAGLLECADVFAVNKADRDGADGTVRDLELMIALGSEAKGACAPDEPWTPPIVRCIATGGEGIALLAEGLERHRIWLETSNAGRARRRARLAEELRDGLREALVDAALQSLGPRVDEAVRQVEEREKDPYSATEDLVAAFKRSAQPGGL